MGMKTVRPGLSSQLADMCLRLLGLTFLALGILKLHGLFYPETTMSEYLDLSNPIFSFLSNRVVLLGAAIAEICVGAGCLSPNADFRARSGSLLWLSAVTLAYKALLVVAKYEGPCGCLLGLNRFLPLSTSTQNGIADVIVIVTFVVSLALLLAACWKRRGAGRIPLAEASPSSR
jgi:hypothetical protein